MVLCHIEAEWSIALWEDGQQCAIATDITGTLMMQLLCVVSWDIPVQVSSLIPKFLYLYSLLLTTYAGAEAHCCARFGPGPNKQPVQQDIFHCRGSESNLLECDRAIGSNCAHSQDSSVICS